ncbi:hypothetical protein AWRI1631_81740 [Saccharomyces cerevisiae AWRI1631]|uniref:Uncharacterized protein n=1 Tax=Saccharomyces cerevisiae (strain AWRI1631) TaxID=545124 RepID=B5VK53_YEAS6|nr:hypothetical protein AWRI1631_81740 [Saccharomyces cerevisiae AWRI1631]
MPSKSSYLICKSLNHFSPIINSFTNFTHSITSSTFDVNIKLHILLTIKWSILGSLRLLSLNTMNVQFNTNPHTNCHGQTNLDAFMLYSSTILYATSLGNSKSLQSRIISSVVILQYFFTNKEFGILPLFLRAFAVFNSDCGFPTALFCFVLPLLLSCTPNGSSSLVGSLSWFSYSSESTFLVPVMLLLLWLFKDKPSFPGSSSSSSSSSSNANFLLVIDGDSLVCMGGSSGITNESLFWLFLTLVGVPNS